MARDGDTSIKTERYARTDEYLSVLKQEWTPSSRSNHSGRFYNVRQGYSAGEAQQFADLFWRRVG